MVGVQGLIHRQITNCEKLSCSVFPQGFQCCGGGERVRTDGLLRARQALSQLSYTPKKYYGFWIANFGFYIQQSKIQNLKPKFGMVGLDGVEPSTSRLSGVRSNQTELQAHTNADVCIRISDPNYFPLPNSEFDSAYHIRKC